MTVILFGKRVFADAIKDLMRRSSWITLSLMTGISIRYARQGRRGQSPVKTETEGGMMQPQCLDPPATGRNEEWLLPGALGGSGLSQHSEFRILPPGHCCCYKPPNLWSPVTATTGNEHPHAREGPQCFCVVFL